MFDQIERFRSQESILPRLFQSIRNKKLDGFQDYHGAAAEERRSREGSPSQRTSIWQGTLGPRPSQDGRESEAPNKQFGFSAEECKKNVVWALVPGWRVSPAAPIMGQGSFFETRIIRDPVWGKREKQTAGDQLHGSWPRTRVSVRGRSVNGAEERMRLVGAFMMHVMGPFHTFMGKRTILGSFLKKIRGRKCDWSGLE